MPTRRQFFAGAAALGLGAALARTGTAARYGRTLGPAVAPGPGRTVALELVAAERQVALPAFDGRALPLWTFSERDWLPVVRLSLGDRLETTLVNRLPRAGEATSIHWHGVRVPADQDGVPYLSQPPVAPGESFRYAFVPPDAGTFFFHTHCNTVEQLGRGLHGVIVVDGDATEPYDDDRVLVLRDWRVNAGNGAFGEFYTLRGAARAGTYGSLRTVNGAVNPEIALPAGADVRLRLVNLDATRVMQLGVDDAEAAVIAIDGMPVAPFPLRSWHLGPAMRIDLVLRAPAGRRTARLVDRSPPGRVELARFTGSGAPKRRTAFEPAPLRAARLAEPDLKAAQKLGFAFRTSEAGRFVASADASSPAVGALCLSQKIFWTINDRAWPDRDHARLPPPLAQLRRGETYVLELRNESPFVHPIHIHGHSFLLLRSNRLARPGHFTDTLLLQPEETAEVALVADNPGDWMLHCHVIEHQESGMMGYLRIA